MDEELSRRSLMGLFGTAALGLWASPLDGAQSVAAGSETSTPASFTPPGVKRDLPGDAHDRPRAVFTQRGNFDLDDPAQLARARLKSIFSIDGTKSYVVRLSRALICPPGAPAQTLLHELLFWNSVIENPAGDSPDPSSVVAHSVFTRVAIDPVTYEPRRTLEVPATGQTLSVPDTLFAASVSMNLATGKERRRDDGASAAVEAGATSPYALLGPDVVFLAKGGHTDFGEHQPQVDMSAWLTPRQELDDPSTGAAVARYSFSGISRTRIFSWASDYDGPEGTQVLTHKLGLKSPTLDGLPESIRNIMQRYYPERI